MQFCLPDPGSRDNAVPSWWVSNYQEGEAFQPGSAEHAPDLHAQGRQEQSEEAVPQVWVAHLGRMATAHQPLQSETSRVPQIQVCNWAFLIPYKYLH